MKRFALIALALTIPLEMAAQVSPPSIQSRTAGRFVAWNYGQWQVQPYKVPAGTGSQTFSVVASQVKLTDGRVIMPFATTAPIFIGKEQVTPTAVGAGCQNANVAIGACTVTATFTIAHTNADVISSATYGLQEALNDAGSSGGGAVTVDSAWAGLGGTAGMISGATLPTNTGIENASTGPASAVPPGWTCTGSGASQVCTAPGTLAAGTTVSANGILTNSIWQREGHLQYGAEPSVLYEQNAQLLSVPSTTYVFKMWSDGTCAGGSFQYSESLTALPGSWTAQAACAITNTGYERTVVRHYGSTYYLFGVNQTGQNSIDLFTGTTGTSFMLSTTGLITTGTSGAWDSQGISTGTVYFDGSIWHMLYQGISATTNWQGGYATASTATGPWTKYSGNPV